MRANSVVAAMAGLVFGASMSPSPGGASHTDPQPPATTKAAPLQDPVMTNDSAFMGVFWKQYGVAFADGAIPAKYKQLSGATMSVVVKCEDCLRYHVTMAIRHGATRKEIVEALRIGMLTGGSSGMPTMGAAYMLMDSLHLK